MDLSVNRGALTPGVGAPRGGPGLVSLATFPPIVKWAVRSLWAAAAGAMTVYGVALIGGPGDPASEAYKALFVALIVLPACLCLVRALLVAEQRWPWAVCGAGMLCWAAGEVAFFQVIEGQESPPYPSIVDGLWIGYYGFSLAALLMLMKAGIARFRTSLWIDALVGALAVAALAAAVVIEPVLDSTGASVAAVATTMAYPFIDVLIVGLLIAVFAISDGRVGRIWALLAVVWTLQGALDIVYLLQATSGTYAFGTWLDFSWPALMLVIAVAAWHKPTVTTCAQEQGWGSLAMTIGFAVVGITLIALDRWHALNSVAIILAALTLAAAFVHTAMTFADMRALASGRELARERTLILDAAGEGIVGTDAAGRVTFMNPAGKRMTGYVPGELTGAACTRPCTTRSPTAPRIRSVTAPCTRRCSTARSTTATRTCTGARTAAPSRSSTRARRSPTQPASVARSWSFTTSRSGASSSTSRTSSRRS